MTDHLPECNWAEPCINGGNHNLLRGDDPSKREDIQCLMCGVDCMCNRLRACEKRVRMVAAQSEANGLRRGWSEALDAARDAVATLECPECSVDAALDVIDALREEKK